MKELDFDELDRAVSSLMTGVPKDQPKAPSPTDEKVLTINSTVPVQSSASSVSEPVASVVTSPSPLISRPANKGRFMDVVHPSALQAKRDSNSALSASRPISRQGVTLSPSSRSAAESQPSPIAVPVEEAPHSQSPISDWPDPIDMATAPVSPAPEASSSYEAAIPSSAYDDSPSAPQGAAQEDATDVSPLTTPFLSDTKVEKRPLGAFALSPESVSLNEDDAVNDTQLTPDPSDTANLAELPAELQTDVMAIEADHSTVASPEDSPSAPTPAARETKDQPAVPLTKPAQTSIPQQYHLEPNTGSMDHAGIYDTEVNQAPLRHPVKQKSGWLFVLWIVILLILGGGGAAALYYMHLI